MSLRPTLSGSLAQVRPLAFGPDRVALGCQTEFDVGTLGEANTVAFLEGLLAEHFGTSVQLQLEKVDAEQASSAPKTLQEIRDSARDGRRAERIREAHRNQAVRTLIDAFGARVRNVRLVEE